jgi:hypothetical protein
LPAACDEFLFYNRLPGVDQSAPRTRRGSTRRRTATGDGDGKAAQSTDLEALGALVTQTLSGLKRRSGDVVLASSLKRTLLRKDPTFDESAYGFRSLSDLLRNLADRNVIQLTTGSAPGDPEVDFPQDAAGANEVFELLRTVVSELGSPNLSGLKNEVRKRRRDFSEKRFGYGDFLQFCKAAESAGFVQMEWDEKADDYIVRPVEAKAAAPKRSPRKRKR